MALVIIAKDVKASLDGLPFEVMASAVDNGSALNGCALVFLPARSRDTYNQYTAQHYHDDSCQLHIRSPLVTACLLWRCGESGFPPAWSTLVESYTA